MKKALKKLFATVTILTVILTMNAGLIGTSFASESFNVDLHSPHIGASSETFQQNSDDNGKTNYVVWHFVLNKTTDEFRSDLTVTFQNAGTKTVSAVKVNNQMQHFYVGTSTHDEIVSASATSGIEGSALRLSHVTINEPEVVVDEEETEEEGTDEEGTDEEGTDEEGTDEEGTDEEGTDEEGTEEEGTDEEETEGNQTPVVKEPTNNGKNETAPNNNDLVVLEDEITPESAPDVPLLVANNNNNETPVIIDEIEELVPLDAPMPKTGENPSMLFIAFGSIISLFGLAIRKN
jgi:LPXTG-motif cell wall-anchored protein